MFRHSFKRKIIFADFKLFKSKLFKEIVKIGWPLGVNMACWVFSQLAIFSFLAILGPQELTTRTYMNTLESFCFMLGVFTSDPNIIAMGSSLNAVGDTRYVMYTSIASLSLIATGLSYWIGIEVGWGVSCCLDWKKRSLRRSIQYRLRQPVLSF